MKQNRKAFFILSALSLLGFFLATCHSDATRSNDSRGPAFAGSLQCRQCHQPIYDLYVKSAHYNTTQAGSSQNIMGAISGNDHRFDYNDSVYIQMEKRDSGVFQVLYVNGKEKEAHRFDILFGVKHAQTSLYWKGDRSFELPVSYYTSVNAWGTSPGFSSTQPDFSRFVGANCFECHSSYIKSQLNASTAGIEETLDRNTLIYGIDCERCHGPATNHVNFHLNNPDLKEPKYIARFAALSREQKLDACAVCHSGNNKISEKSTFRFKPGDTLAHYFTIWPDREANTTTFDVHGNQYQLLSQSPCFLKTKTLDCSSCHNPHSNASTDLKIYSAKCIGCHNAPVHSEETKQKAAAPLENNCIDCHMPTQASQAITFRLPRSMSDSAYLLRTHRIGIYRTREMK